MGFLTEVYWDQSSVLFINDLPDDILSLIVMFADNTKLLSTNRPPGQMIGN